ncbi:MAG TPA: peptidase M4, partial [Anaerolineae bacterium]|nr:peptidase M4 [Anaerolineae bacterium]
MKALRTVAAFIFAFLMIAAWTASSSAKETNDFNGFRGVAGAAAKNFEMPRDMQHRNTQELARYGATMARYDQFHGNARVFGGQVTVWEKGAETAVVGAHYNSIVPSNELKLRDYQARNIAAGKTGQAGDWFTELMITPEGRYFYIVDNQQEAARWISWVDAETGKVFNHYNALTTGSGTGVLGDTKDLTGLTSASGSGYQMVSADGYFETFDAGTRSRLPGSIGTDADDYWTDGAMVDAQYYASVTNDYYTEIHGISWAQITGLAQARSSVHVQRNYNNAYWNGQQMAYGDGDGVIFV